MTVGDTWTRARAKFYRTAARWLCRRPFRIDTAEPLISFTFDDFPKSALLTGGAILHRFGFAGTYYTSLGLMDREEASGAMFSAQDLEALWRQGHELGCHTYDHCHSWRTKSSVFERSILENQRSLGRLLPGAYFPTFSYPISEPRALTKRTVARHYVCARGGGQTYNAGTADLNYLSAYFLEKSRNDSGAVKKMIDSNRQARGWLIFATHDVCENPSPYGCTPEFFETIVQYAANSGARILPVARAWHALRQGKANGTGHRSAKEKTASQSAGD
jgi:peptidoglycan/xylan/chitin deacetylase (PgdA/CDA1 family)